MLKLLNALVLSSQFSSVKVEENRVLARYFLHESSHGFVVWHYFRQLMVVANQDVRSPVELGTCLEILVSEELLDSLYFLKLPVESFW